MRIQDLTGKKILMLGYGKEGHSVVLALKAAGIDVPVSVTDRYPDEPVMVREIRGEKESKPKALTSLSDYDIIIKSPGIPPNDELTALGTKVTSATQLFFDTVAETGAVIVGVTGSKGKSTTSTLIHDILKAAGKDVYLVGNIGKPSLDYLPHAKPGAIFVHELSSYQLLSLSVSPPVAVVTSFFPEHLDYHGSLEAYRDAKAHVARFQKPEDIIFYCGESEGATWIANQGPAKKVPFSATDCPVTIEETHLLGRHNLSNMGGAAKAAAHFGIGPDVCAGVFREFRGLPHRLQSLGVQDGIEWVDDAISTTPESAIAALDSLGDRVVTMILGGQDRGNDFTGLAKRIKDSSVRTVIVFPGSGPRIREAIGDAQADVCFHNAPTMEDAVSWARRSTMEGKICLLSTASPSYNMFKNFEEKGDVFRKCIFGAAA